jgi:hypothetical protein
MNNAHVSALAASCYAPRGAGWQQWLEVLVLSAGVFYAASVSQPGDPLLQHQPFPWLWLAPVLLALRYGSLAGLGSALLLAASWVFFYDRALQPVTMPTQFFLGGMILTLGAGQFADIWRGRLSRVREVNHYLDERLDALTRAHYLLKHDQERLEQELLVKPLTLRHALLGLRRLPSPRDAAGDRPLPCARELLGVLAQACQIEVASLHEEVDGHIQAEPVACLGQGRELDAHDPLLALMLEHNRLCHVQTATLPAASSRYLVVAPVTSAEGARKGVLVVERMPFLALNEECLQLLAVALGYYADVVRLPAAVRQLQRKLPDCPLSFAAELLRLDRVYRECHIASTLVALGIDVSVAHQEQLFGEILLQQRHLDTNWPLQGRQRKILLTLMPLHGGEAALGYRRRLEQRLQERFGVSAASPGITLISASVGQQSVDELLSGVLEQCHAT